jgi:hypothetical protein
MGHNVTGLIALPSTLEAFAAARRLPSPVPLSAGFAMLPLRDDDLDSFLTPPLTGHFEGFCYLCDQLAGDLRALSSVGPIVYFETDFFGGKGTQGAAVFREGQLVYCRASSAIGQISDAIGPINDALRLIGVVITPPNRDEFETVELHRFRSTEDWLERVGRRGHE